MHTIHDDTLDDKEAQMHMPVATVRASFIAWRDENMWMMKKTGKQDSRKTVRDELPGTAKTHADFEDVLHSNEKSTVCNKNFDR